MSAESELLAHQGPGAASLTEEQLAMESACQAPTLNEPPRVQLDNTISEDLADSDWSEQGSTSADQAALSPHSERFWGVSDGLEDLQEQDCGDDDALVEGQEREQGHERRRSDTWLSQSSARSDTCHTSDEEGQDQEQTNAANGIPGVHSDGGASSPSGLDNELAMDELEDVVEGTRRAEDPRAEEAEYQAVDSAAGTEEALSMSQSGFRRISNSVASALKSSSVFGEGSDPSKLKAMYAVYADEDGDMNNSEDFLRFCSETALYCADFTEADAVSIYETVSAHHGGHYITYPAFEKACGLIAARKGVGISALESAGSQPKPADGTDGASRHADEAVRDETAENPDADEAPSTLSGFRRITTALTSIPSSLFGDEGSGSSKLKAVFAIYADEDGGMNNSEDFLRFCSETALYCADFTEADAVFIYETVKTADHIVNFQAFEKACMLIAPKLEIDLDALVTQVSPASSQEPRAKAGFFSAFTGGSVGFDEADSAKLGSWFVDYCDEDGCPLDMESGDDFECFCDSAGFFDETFTKVEAGAIYAMSKAEGREGYAVFEKAVCAIALEKGLGFHAFVTQLTARQHAHVTPLSSTRKLVATAERKTDSPKVTPNPIQRMKTEKTESPNAIQRMSNAFGGMFSSGEQSTGEIGAGEKSTSAPKPPAMVQRMSGIAVGPRRSSVGLTGNVRSRSAGLRNNPTLESPASPRIDELESSTGDSEPSPYDQHMAGYRAQVEERHIENLAINYKKKHGPSMTFEAFICDCFPNMLRVEQDNGVGPLRTINDAGRKRQAYALLQQDGNSHVAAVVATNGKDERTESPTRQFLVPAQARKWRVLYEGVSVDDKHRSYEPVPKKDAIRCNTCATPFGIMTPQVRSILQLLSVHPTH